jgi:UDPglucose 6-dehydrogenase
MRVTIFGSGYVGLVTGACLAEAGNHVVCVDVDAGKIERLNKGEVPIHEPGLDALIKRNAEAGRLEFTTDAPKAVEHGLFQIIAVGTPPDEDGSADLRYVLAAARTIGTHVNRYTIVITKSTVPVGTADKVRKQIDTTFAERNVNFEFDVVSNPEFLKEGAAIQDFMKPDRVVIGTDNPRTQELMRALYEPFTRQHDRLIVMDIRSSELTKYAANAMLATKISFMNELANIAERVGADIEKVRVGIGSDPRIGYSFIYPGAGYGGSCFPKDVSALKQLAGNSGYHFQLLTSVIEVNELQKRRVIGKLRRHLGSLRGRTVVLLGLAFKPDTNDIREASSLVLASRLLAEGAHVKAWDPVAIEGARQHLPGVELCEDLLEAVSGADAAVVVTEWDELRAFPRPEVRSAMRSPLIVDGRNFLEPEAVRKAGFVYEGIGKPPAGERLTPHPAELGSALAPSAAAAAQSR